MRGSPGTGPLRSVHFFEGFLKMTSRTQISNGAVAAVLSGALLAFNVAQIARAVPPDTGATFTNPQAQGSLEAGVAALKGAQALEAQNSGTASQAQDMAPALRDAYTRARAAFQDAAQSDPTMAEAWNGLGYSQRKLGDYDTALASYGRALTLKPGYPEATEYRGEAYLALNRIDDAKQAYLDLFATHRALADTLMNAMKKWIAAQKSGATKASAVDLSKWIDERAKIAAQTASLTREDTAAGWH
jgi:tetratricopeptide (TPR) repeat protein